jgi:hypothetical protein
MQRRNPLPTLTAPEQKSKSLPPTLNPLTVSAGPKTMPLSTPTMPVRTVENLKPSTATAPSPFRRQPPITAEGQQSLKSLPLTPPDLPSVTEKVMKRMEAMTQTQWTNIPPGPIRISELR